MKSVEVGTPASEELVSAIGWYETRRGGLGAEFYDAVNRTIERIRTHPEIGTPHSARLPHRRLVVARFPYSVVYRVREHDIYVVAVAHASRRPNYWKHRPSSCQ